MRIKAFVGVVAAVLLSQGALATTSSAQRIPEPGGCWQPGTLGWGCAKFIPGTGDSGTQDDCYGQQYRPHKDDGRVHTRSRILCDHQPYYLNVQAQADIGGTSDDDWSPIRYCGGGNMSRFNDKYWVCTTRGVSVPLLSGDHTYYGWFRAYGVTGGEHTGDADGEVLAEWYRYKYF